MKIPRAILAALTLVALLVPVAAVGAQTTYECVDVGYWEVCFLGVTNNPDGTSTWTYSVTSDDVCGGGPNGTKALSHWDLALCGSAFDDVVDPELDEDGKGMYETFSPFDSVEGRVGIMYAVEVGPDGSIEPPVYGIKFGDAMFPTGGEANLGEDCVEETDIFQFTLGHQYPTIGVEVATKAGGDVGMVEYISGPACEPTAVTLASSAARAGVSSVTLVWETGTELDTAGFNVYRATAPEGTYTQVNGALIPAKGDAVTGASYRFLNKGISPGTYYYKLEEVSLNGATTLYALGAARVLPSLRKPAYRPTAPR